MDDSNSPSGWKVIGFLIAIGIMMFGDFTAGMICFAIMHSGDIIKSAGNAWQRGVFEAQSERIKRDYP